MNKKLNEIKKGLANDSKTFSRKIHTYKLTITRKNGNLTEYLFKDVYKIFDREGKQFGNIKNECSSDYVYIAYKNKPYYVIDSFLHFHQCKLQ